MSEPALQTLELGDGRRLAYERIEGEGPGVLFCPGFTSDLTGTKASALAAHCRRRGRAFTRFDYTGHGQSSGRFEDGTIGAWMDDALSILDQVTAGPQVIVGSSMGGWVMLRLALERPERVQALIGIAPAPDFTEDLILPRATAEQLAQLEAQGFWLQPSDDGDPPYPITRALLDDGRRQCLLKGDGLLPIRAPLHLLHGQEDEAVPWQTSLHIASKVESPDVTIELTKSGDHRLSRPTDLTRLLELVDNRALPHPA